MKKIVSLSLAICLLMLAATGIVLAGKDTLTIGTGVEATKFFPINPTGTNNNDYAIALTNLYDTLVKLNAKGEIEPALATSYSVSADGLCYTFTLREGVKFHDGSLMTADDVVFSLNKSAPLASGKALLINFDRAEKVDAKTVKVYLTAPYSGFINGIASRVGMIVSKKHYDKVGDAGYEAKPIGTGPYKLVSVVNGDTLTLEAFDQYWGGAPAIKKVYVKLIPDTATQIIALENGDIDLLMSPPISSCLMLDTRKGVKWVYGPSAGRVTMHLSTNKGTPGHDDLNFRRAVQSAVNKQDIIIGAMEGYATQIDIDMCPTYSGHPEGYKVVGYDVKKAKEYLAASKYKGEEFQILVQSGTIYEMVAQIVQAQLMEIGINCTVNAVDSATFTDLWYAGKFGAMIRNTNSSLLDADGFLNFYMATDYAPTNNNQHPRTKEIYDIGLEARKAQGEARKELYRKAVDIVTDEAYAVPIFASTNTLAYNSNLQGVEVHPLGTLHLLKLSWK
ncbi:MAG: ABC transporter substrate-binding protein [Firmicutes bacterium]|nr:ABC transporter substrate-binding protein [Bacillota bacterium]